MNKGNVFRIAPNARIRWGWNTFIICGISVYMNSSLLAGRDSNINAILCIDSGLLESVSIPPSNESYITLGHGAFSLTILYVLSVIRRNACQEGRVILVPGKPPDRRVAFIGSIGGFLRRAPGFTQDQGGSRLTVHDRHISNKNPPLRRKHHVSSRAVVSAEIAIVRSYSCGINIIGAKRHKPVLLASTCLPPEL
ncbi:predicted protein [Histoplasma capsulatum G186AR]|uniref:Uncharacterized protein n=1 Tax=Ajellomyces capsulatus (strain G186AR / H82 / ATCC MYA-2454 / RMSCC 2432) TaxID=447093 RepID=C0NF44_AJECG|nr:uncharacterized protein HCBG_01510 [Histoplasma capsulatum G186AR]EEH09865.1 predicted protein [Histoplasma capsulatum G186AR]